jgi:hypothetical protein
VFWLLGVKPILGSLWIIAGTSLLSSGWSILGYELSEWGLGFQVCINLQILSLQITTKEIHRSQLSVEKFFASEVELFPTFLLFPVLKPIHRSEKLERSIAATSSKKRSITAKSSKELRSRSNSFAPDAVVASWVSDNSPKQQKKQEKTKPIKHQNSYFTKPTEEEQSLFLCMLQWPIFSFRLWRRLELSNTVLVVQQQERESTT